MIPSVAGEEHLEQDLLSQVFFCTAGEEEGMPPSCTFLHPATEAHSPATG